MGGKIGLGHKVARGTESPTGVIENREFCQGHFLEHSKPPETPTLLTRLLQGQVKKRVQLAQQVQHTPRAHARNRQATGSSQNSMPVWYCPFLHNCSHTRQPTGT